MKIRFSDLWRWDGTVDRGTYALIGMIGFAIKHNLDRLVASVFFHRRWELFNYWAPFGKIVRIDALSREEILFVVAMLVMALPFIWVGVVLTLKRLRSAGLPSWLVAFFFAPFINLVFFLLLCVLPSREGKEFLEITPGGRFKVLLDRLIPEHPVGSAAMALLLTIPFGIAAVQFGVLALSRYGWGLFVALPFCLGFAAALLHGYRRPRSFQSCLLVSGISTTLLGVALVAFAIEGVVCVAMAAPLGFILSAIGASMGYAIQRRPWSKGEIPSLLLLLIAIVPMLMGAEAVVPLEPPTLAVRSAVEINATPSEVWHRVITFSDLPPPQEWFFKIGIPYPMKAEIHGTGVGAERRCIFSSGPFIQSIQVWDEPRSLKFSEIAQPPVLKEWTPYPGLHPPHLDYLRFQGGEFLLMPLPNGHTRLEGTTWYRHDIWPSAYWEFWANWIMHRIHLRVLNHVKFLAEHGDYPGEIR